MSMAAAIEGGDVRHLRKISTCRTRDDKGSPRRAVGIIWYCKRLDGVDMPTPPPSPSLDDWLDPGTGRQEVILERRVSQPLPRRPHRVPGMQQHATGNKLAGSSKESTSTCLPQPSRDGKEELTHHGHDAIGSTDTYI